jgi:hypothetical protein
VTDEIENGKTRRTALKNVAQVAVAAPAVSLLLDSNTKALAQANVSVSEATLNHALDDFTYGNSHEDLGQGPVDDPTAPIVIEED